jgi:hypothetical protein
LEEGQKIAQADEEYKKKQKDYESKKWTNALALRKQLDDMKQDVKERKEKEKLAEQEHDKRIQTWVSRKSRQNQLKKDLEAKWFR